MPFLSCRYGTRRLLDYDEAHLGQQGSEVGQQIVNSLVSCKGIWFLIGAYVEPCFRMQYVSLSLLVEQTRTRDMPVYVSWRHVFIFDEYVLREAHLTSLVSA